MYFTKQGQFLENDNRERKSVGSGDSGGPLTFQGTDQSHTLIGVTSFGYDGRMSGFANVALYREWINDNANIETCVEGNNQTL